jgi:hypothetical protein
MRAPSRRLAARLALVAALAAAPGAAAELTQPLVTVSGEQAQVSLQLDGAFDEALLARLDSGLPTAFAYRLELHRDRKHWWDARLASTTFEVVAMYNAVSQEYLVNFKHDGRLVESRLVRSRDELITAMTRLERVPLLSLAGIAKGTRLLVSARAELGSRTMLGFIPADIETDWVTSRKFRVP